MDMIGIIWQIRINFNKVEIAGTAPISNDQLADFITKILIAKAVEFIERAEKFAECIVLSEEPNGPTHKEAVEVSLSIMFKNPLKAAEFAKAIGGKS